jgi:flagellin-specific chaperone FliS
LKTEKKTLAKLAQEYEKHIELQQYFIDKCKDDIKRAEKVGDNNAVIELKSKLQKFYEIKRELSETADILKNYYKGDDELDSL